MYKEELKALKKAGLFRERVLFEEDLIDLASNDYLSLAKESEIFEKAVERVRRYRFHSPRASQLVNGYHEIHREFEEYLKELNGFEDAIVVGSGFLANLSLIEALPRRGDLLVLDEEFHASGILSSKLTSSDVAYFRHNDSKDLERIIKRGDFNRVIIAIEGIYSMSGDIVCREIFNIADRYGAILIIDEAHSSGVLGDNFIGVLEHYNLPIKNSYIKMGTLGKAIGSYGAYILSSREIISFLENRAKAIIYATAPSLFDIALAHESMLFIRKRAKEFKERRSKIKEIVKDIFSKEIDGLILDIEIGDNQKVMELKSWAKSQGFLIGAIRPPTVKRAILRVILNIGERDLRYFLEKLKEKIDEI
jgi:8-amino-7-oxononanoate synthase